MDNSIDNSNQGYRKSAGDVGFDLAVYLGLGWVANAAISLAVERYAVQLPGTPLHVLGQKAETWFARRFETIMKDPKAVDYWAKKSNQILFLGSGGWLMLIPMKWLEDHKVNIIRSIDTRLGTGPQTPEGIAEQINAISSAPRQGVVSLITGRIVSYTATVALALPLVTKWTNTSDRVALFLEKTLGHQLHDLRAPTIVIGEKQIPAFLNSVAVEGIMAGTAAVLQYASSKAAAMAGQYISGSSPPQTQVTHISQSLLQGQAVSKTAVLSK